MSLAPGNASGGRVFAPFRAVFAERKFFAFYFLRFKHLMRIGGKENIQKRKARYRTIQSADRMCRAESAKGAKI